MNIWSVILAIIILIVVYGIFIFSFIIADGLKYLNCKRFSTTAMYLLIFLITSAFVIFTIEQNNFIYFWDYGNYWTLSIALTNDFFSNPFVALNNVYTSINTQDYNSFLALLMCLPLKICGNSFSTFVFLNHVMFLFPTFLTLIACLNKVSSFIEEESINNKKSLFNCCVCLFPVFYFAMFRGFMDVAILLPIALIFLITIDFDILQFDRCNIFKDLVIAVLLVIMLIFRRYSAFFVLGYVCSLAVVAIFSLIQKEEKYYGMKSFIINYGTIGVTSISVLLIFFREFFLNALLTDYAGLYVAYNAPLINKVEGVISKVGFVTIFFILTTLGLTLFCYKNLTAFITLLFLNTIITAGSFFHVQIMGDHHAYILAVQILLLVLIGIKECLHICKGKLLLIPVLSITFIICNFLYGFLPLSALGKVDMSKIFVAKYTPLIREDIKEVERMADYLNALASENNQSIYVAASGVILNSDVIRAVYKPDSLNAVSGLLSTSEIDLRDGFPLTFLEADIIVTSNPIELHTAVGTQEVVRFLAQEVMDGDSIIGKCFEKKEVFRLDNNIEAYVYIRKAEFGEEEINYLRGYYESYYPEHEELFGTRLDSYLEAIKNNN